MAVMSLTPCLQPHSSVFVIHFLPQSHAAENAASSEDVSEDEFEIESVEGIRTNVEVCEGCNCHMHRQHTVRPCPIPEDFWLILSCSEDDP